jgi:hypothetical protein
LLDRLRAAVGPTPTPAAEPAIAVRREAEAPPLAVEARAAPRLARLDKPAIAWLRETDVERRVVAAGGQRQLDLGCIGWPALRIGASPDQFTEAMRELRVAAIARSSSKLAPVLAVVGQRGDDTRTIGALNAALAAAHDGIDVLLIDADFHHATLSRRLDACAAAAVAIPGGSQSGLGAPIETSNGVTVLPITQGADATVATDAACAIIDHARRTTECGLIVLDGPSIPLDGRDGALLALADGIVAVLPANLAVNDAMEEILAALDGASPKLLAVVLSELGGAEVPRAMKYA